MSYKLEGVVVFERDDAEWSLGIRYAVEVETDFGVGLLSVVPKGRRLRVGDWWVPQRFSVRAEFGTLRYTCDLAYVCDDSGRPQCASLTLFPSRSTKSPWESPDTGKATAIVFTQRTTFTTNGLRELPIGHLERLGRLAAMRRGTSMAATAEAVALDDWADLFHSPPPDPQPKRKRAREKVPIDLLELATIVRAADRYPTKAVQTHFSVSRSTARRRIREAVAHGLLIDEGENS